MQITCNILISLRSLLSKNASKNVRIKKRNANFKGKYLSVFKRNVIAWNIIKRYSLIIY